MLLKIAMFLSAIAGIFLLVRYLPDTIHRKRQEGKYLKEILICVNKLIDKRPSNCYTEYKKGE